MHEFWLRKEESVCLNEVEKYLLITTLESIYIYFYATGRNAICGWK